MIRLQRHNAITAIQKLCSQILSVKKLHESNFLSFLLNMVNFKLFDRQLIRNTETECIETNGAESKEKTPAEHKFWQKFYFY